jgi:copper chaperone CopZ
MTTPTVRSERFTLSGLRCPRCAATVAHALHAVPGVAVARVGITSSVASVDYDPMRTTPRALAAAVRDAGYDVVDGEARSSDSVAAQRRSAPAGPPLPSEPTGPWYPEVQLMLGILFGVAGLLFVLEHGWHLISAWVLLLVSASLVGDFFLRRYARRRCAESRRTFVRRSPTASAEAMTL